jgi:hypothetical protein
VPYVSGVMTRCFQISESMLMRIMADPTGEHKVDFLVRPPLPSARACVTCADGRGGGGRRVRWT